MSTASNNVANVNTPGFSRKRANLSPSPSIITNAGRIGQGVQITSVVGLRDQFIEQQVRTARSDSGWNDMTYQQLEMTEQIMSEISQNGLGNVLDRFWNAWHDLAADPTANAARNTLLVRSESLVERFKLIDTRIADHNNRINGQIALKVDRINAILNELSLLNVEFSRGLRAPDLEDRRGLLLDELSDLAKIAYKTAKNGSTTVFIDGKTVLLHDNVNLIDIHKSNGSPLSLVLSSSNTGVDITGGEIGALFSVRDGEINDLHERLDELASTLAKEINEIHAAGYGLDGNSGRLFFSGNTTGIADIALSDDIQDKPSLIAVSSSNTSIDNTIALEIAGLENSAILSDGNETITQAYQSTTAWFGTVVAEAEISAEGAVLALEQANSWRESVSGVSLDEEMAELIRFQHAFNAAAKVIGGVNKMLDAVIALGN